VQYPGGKNGSGVYQTLINQIPPHDVYIEGFLGSGAIMRRKRLARWSVGIDKDSAVLEMWREIKKGFRLGGNITLLNDDTIEFLESRGRGYVVTGAGRMLNKKSTLLYLDPPYLMETRSCRRPIYNHEMSDSDHERLLEIITGLRCMVMISGYYSEMYVQALDGWRAIQYPAQTRGGRTVTEWAWMNYPEPTQLHDYSYLGDDFRERERIKRKRERWVNRLLTLPPLEKAAIIEALQTIE